MTDITVSDAPAADSHTAPAAVEPVGSTDNSIFIAADIDFVWTMTNDLVNWPALFTEYASVDILEHSGNTYRFRLTMHPDENGNIWSWVSERTLDPVQRRVSARRVEPGPFEFMNIEWQYTSVDGGTTMRWLQEFAMRPTAPVTTRAMTDRINANSKIQQSVIARKVEDAARKSAEPGPAA
jgi:aromatase